MEHGPTSWEVDEVSDESLVRLWKIQPSEDYREEVESLRKPEKVKIGDLLDRIANYAEKFEREVTSHKGNTGSKTDNPLEGNQPYEMSNPSFVYWCFEANNVPLFGKKARHTTRDIVYSPRLDTVYSVGSSVNLEGLLRGDLVFLNRDKHVGIYLGEGDFISMVGPDGKNSPGGVQINNLKDVYWNKLFSGHVKRLVR